MFALTDADLQKSIVGCGDGPASFNAELTKQGGRVVSFDPVYSFTAAEIASRFEESADSVMGQVRSSPDSWTWKYHKNPDDLLQNRRDALALFLADFESGKVDGRYLAGEFPVLDFPNSKFKLALCSHFLFLYSKHFSLDFHRTSILEMCRIAKEVRVFPILTLKQEMSPYLEPIIEELCGIGFQAEVRKVNYELQKNGNQALFITRL
ncbi:MAG: SAM-dependent methyltransferase [Verrucomicrobiales bacterium]